MKILPAAIQRDILKRFAGPFFFCFFVIVALLVMQFLILFTDRLVGKDLPMLTILELIFSNLASLIVLAVPMSVLASSLMVYGKVSELNEYTSLRAAGVHPWHLLQPVFVIAVSLFFGMMYFSNIILPQANLEAKRLWTDIRLLKPAFDVQPGVFYEGIDGYTFLARQVDNETDTLYNITLYRDQGSSGRAVFRAEKGHLASEPHRQTLHLQLFDGNVTRWIPQTNQKRLLEQSSFGMYSIRFDISNLNPSRTNPDDIKNDRSMNIAELKQVIDSISTEIQIQRSIFDRKENFYVRAITSYTKPADTLAISTYLSPENRLPDYMLQNMKSSGIAFLEMDLIPANDRITMMRNTIESLRSSRLDFENLALNIRWRQERIAEYQVEIYKKYAVPFVTIIFFLCGATIGLLSRRGNLGFAAIVSAVLSTVYWISIIQGEKWADRLYVSPLWGIWGGNILLGTLAIVLLLKLIRERLFSNSIKHLSPS
jgi:lipopolysaccharide export system permease protein